jgi:ethanolamine ammonia-lyase small subunit
MPDYALKDPIVEQSSIDIVSGTVIESPWRDLRRFTDARIGLGRAGNSIPSRELLKFQLAHAQAMDAVHVPLNVERICADITAAKNTVLHPKTLVLHSQATDRMVYLQRPDLGRQLDTHSCKLLSDYCSNSCDNSNKPVDLAIVVADGLSSRAVQQHAVPMIQALTHALQSDISQIWTFAPISIVKQGRVAVGDGVGELLNANAVLVLIGERPGLSSPDSLGMYLTWKPKRGLDDASRNCISNVRPHGLSYAEASRLAFYLLTESRRLALSGVDLKDRSNTDSTTQLQEINNFLLPKTS